MSPTTAAAMESFNHTLAATAGASGHSTPGTHGTTSGAASASSSPADPEEAQKREQLKAMYLAGFRAAQSKAQAAALKENFAKASQQPPPPAGGGAGPGSAGASPALIPPEGAGDGSQTR